MSHKSQRKERQRQQKMQLQEHQPQQRAQRRQREQREQRQWAERREQKRQLRHECEKRRMLQRSYKNKASQTDIVQPLARPEPQVEHVQEPQVQRLPLLDHVKMWMFFLSLGLCLGYWISWVFTRRAPRASGAMNLAMRVAAAEVGRVVFGHVNEVAMFWASVVSSYGGFWEYVLLLAMLVMLVGHYGEMYIVRQEPAEDDPHGDGDGNVSEDSSQDDFFSLDDFYTVGGALEEETSGSESESDSEDVVARAA
ncbi:uncharacterized protein TrAtP1_006658 [Trichoderma atroviride]|uniref:uncharacterized protein n=1 Tax=Hypocrea atroviridis TaxID=63577 RepID=UPI003327C10C|nr:hypothetical protein TrAtP1_006658 [Trichoderma atroviride]